MQQIKFYRVHLYVPFFNFIADISIAWTIQPIDLKFKNVQTLLNAYDRKYRNKNFCTNDPVQIPMRYKTPLDREISAFLVSVICWGNRKAIIQAATRWMDAMGSSPYEFVQNYSAKDYTYVKSIYYRTFNSEDCHHLLLQLQKLLRQYASIEACFMKLPNCNLEERIRFFRRTLLNKTTSVRLHHHISNIDRNAASKRLCLFLKWMVRSGEDGLDLGVWKNLKPFELMIPMDVHVGKAAFDLNIINSRTANWKRVKEISERLTQFDPLDPIKYDTALFCIGAGFTI